MLCVRWCSEAEESAASAFAAESAKVISYCDVRDKVDGETLPKQQ